MPLSPSARAIVVESTKRRALELARDVELVQRLVGRHQQRRQPVMDQPALGDLSGGGAAEKVDLGALLARGRQHLAELVLRRRDNE